MNRRIAASAHFQPDTKTAFCAALFVLSVAPAIDGEMYTMKCQKYPAYLCRWKPALLVITVVLLGCESGPIYYERNLGQECNLPNPDAPLKPISLSGQSLEKNGRFAKRGSRIYLFAVHGPVENHQDVANKPTDAEIQFHGKTLKLRCRNEAAFSTYTHNPEFEAAKRRAAETGQSVDLVEYGSAKYQQTYHKPNQVRQWCDVDYSYLLSLPRTTSFYFTFKHPTLETRSGRFEASDLPFCAKKFGLM